MLLRQSWLALVAMAVLLAAPARASTSIVDLLSSSPDFTLLIRALQRSGLIPVLNMGRNITFFAPSNEVIGALPEHEQLMLPILLEYLIVTEPIVSSLSTEVEHIYFSHLRATSAPDVPLPLKVEWVRSQSGDNDDGAGRRVVLGSGQANVVKHDWVADNGIIQVVDGLVSLPHELCDSLATAAMGSEISTFVDMFAMHPMICRLLLHAQDTATVLAPVNAAFNSLNAVELSYLRSLSGHDDRLRFLGMHFLYTSIYRQNDTGAGIEVPSLTGPKVKFSALDSGIKFNNKIEALDYDNVYDNGVLHTLPELLTPPSYFQFTPRKYMQGLGAADFADELDFHSFGPAIDDVEIEQTIFAVVDEGRMADATSPSLLSYHFLDVVLPSQLVPGTYATKFPIPSFCCLFQRLRITVDVHRNIRVNGEARVLHEPVRIGNTAIVLVDRTIPMPPPLREAAASSVFTVSKSLAVLDALGLLDSEELSGATVFLPEDAAWDGLGLTGEFIAANPAVARAVLLRLVLTEPVYADDLDDGPSEHGTWFGKSEKESISVYSNGDSVILSGPYTTDATVPIVHKDIFFAGGVIHTIGAIPLPDDVRVTAKDLLSTAKVTDFVNLAEAAGLEEFIAPSSPAVILAPQDTVMAFADLTASTPDLRTILGLHVLRRRTLHGGTFGSAMGTAYDTAVPNVHALLTKTPTSNADGLYLLHVSQHLGPELKTPIRILASGLTTSGGEVYVVDSIAPLPTTPVQRPNWWRRHGVLVALGAAFGIVAIFLIGMFWVWLLFRRSGSRWGRLFPKKPLASYLRFRPSFAVNGRSIDAGDNSDEDDEDEEAPLIRAGSNGDEVIDIHDANADAVEMEAEPSGPSEETS